MNRPASALSGLVNLIGQKVALVLLKMALCLSGLHGKVPASATLRILSPLSSLPTYKLYFMLFQKEDKTQAGSIIAVVTARKYYV